jgi:hypothetical protein
MLTSWAVSKSVALDERVILALERQLIKTEREAVEWLYHRNRAARQGHLPTHVRNCQDGKCVRVTK